MAGIIGYFAIMLLFMIIAAVRAKKGFPWIWYIIGAVIQLISLIGISRNPFYNSGPYWIVYFCILLLFFFIILSKSAQKGDSEIHYILGNTEVQNQTSVSNYPTAEEKKQENPAWICNRCGNNNSAHVFICRFKKVR